MIGEEVDLILVAGQSNAVGADSPMDQLPPDPSDKNVMFWWRAGKKPPDAKDSSSAQEWMTLQAQPRGRDKNFNCKGGGFGPEIGLARTLLEKQPKRKIAIVKVAYNATSIAVWERKNPVFEQKKSYENCYEALFVETKLAIEKAGKRGITLVPRAFIWVQGESDASKELVPEYKDSLQQLIKNVKKDFNAPKMISLLAVNTKFRYGKMRSVKEIAQEQKKLAAQDKLIEYIDSSNLETCNAYHFSAKGTLDLGKLFAEALMKMEK
ncbi:sialate O-acetylesterase [Verrucomicrobiota bacterium]